MNKVYCRYCGKQIDEDATFCTYCGKEQNVHKASSWDVEKIKGNGKSIGKKALALIRVPYDYARTIKFPQMSAEKTALWRKRIKYFVKTVLILSIVALIICAGVGGYIYYNDEYLPKKQLDEACTDILKKLHSNQDSIKLEYSIHILWTNHKWGYENVDDREIHKSMNSYLEEAFRNVEKAAYNNNARAQYGLGQLYFYDESCISQDTVKAVYWWNEAVKHNYVRAYNNMGHAYENGIGGLNQNVQKAAEFYRIGAEKGESYAQANYGRMFMDGVKIKVGSHKEIKKQIGSFGYEGIKILEYYDDDIREDIVISQVEVDDYEWLIPQDMEKAKYWWHKSAAQGNEYAKELLQKVYE